LVRDLYKRVLIVGKDYPGEPRRWRPQTILRVCGDRSTNDGQHRKRFWIAPPPPHLMRGA